MLETFHSKPEVGLKLVIFAAHCKFRLVLWPPRVPLSFIFHEGMLMKFPLSYCRGFTLAFFFVGDSKPAVASTDDIILDAF